MKINHKNILMFLFCYLILLMSCKNNEKGTENESEYFSVKKKEYRFILNPDLNTRYKYEIVNENSTEQEVNNSKTKSETNVEMLVSYIINKDTSRFFNFSMLYNKFKLNVKALDQELAISSANAEESFSPVERIFGAFKDASINMKVDEKGTVSYVSGFSELAERMRVLANGDNDALQMLNTNLRPFIGKDNIKSLFENSFKLLPDSLLREGSRWVVAESITNDLNEKGVNTYIVESIKDGVITVTSQMDIDIKEQPTMLDGTIFNTTLVGNQTGEFKIEIASGMLISSNSNLKLRGDISVLGRNVPLNIVTNKRVKRIV